MTPALDAALAEAGVGLDELDAIAVTSGPGLAGALMVGVGAAKALAVALGQAALRRQPPRRARRRRRARADDGSALESPTVALLVSGGHTSLLLVRDLVDDVELLGETIDDAAGEAFDKVARLLGLPYPGGPQIDRAAVGGDPKAIRFPRGLILPKDLAAPPLRLLVLGPQDRGRPLGREAPGRRARRVPVADVAASFREAVVDVLLTKALAACADLGVPAPAARRRRGRERPRARARGRAVRGGRASSCASRRCRSAPTTAR